MKVKATIYAIKPAINVFFVTIFIVFLSVFYFLLFYTVFTFIGYSADNSEINKESNLVQKKQISFNEGEITSEQNARSRLTSN